MHLHKNLESRVRKQCVLERVFVDVSVADLWNLWTTQDGLESWFGPEGFNVKVTSLELRSGGELTYMLMAIGPEQIAFIKEAGLPSSTECVLSISDVIHLRRLAFSMVADFFLNTSAYEVTTVIQIEPVASGAILTVTFDAMHDDHWTDRVRACHLSQLQKLVDQLRRRI